MSRAHPPSRTKRKRARDESRARLQSRSIERSDRFAKACRAEIRRSARERSAGSGPQKGPGVAQVAPDKTALDPSPRDRARRLHAARQQVREQGAQFSRGLGAERHQRLRTRRKRPGRAGTDMADDRARCRSKSRQKGGSSDLAGRGGHEKGRARSARPHSGSSRPPDQALPVALSTLTDTPGPMEELSEIRWR